MIILPSCHRHIHFAAAAASIASHFDRKWNRGGIFFHFTVHLDVQMWSWAKTNITRRTQHVAFLNHITWFDSCTPTGNMNILDVPRSFAGFSFSLRFTTVVFPTINPQHDGVPLKQMGRMDTTYRCRIFYINDRAVLYRQHRCANWAR